MSNRNQISNNSISTTLLGDIRKMIEDSRLSVAVTVNAALTMLYWQIGKRIREDVLKGARAEYGKEIVVSLSRQLVSEYGNSFSEKNLRRMIQFAEVFPSEEIVVSLIRQLWVVSWVVSSLRSSGWCLGGVKSTRVVAQIHFLNNSQTDPITVHDFQYYICN